jgi:hypothetical protein
VTGSLVEGFDAAVDVAVIGGRKNTIRNCMFVRAKSNDGWAFVVRNMPGGDPVKNPKRLVVERCTVKGKGLLDAVGFTPESPLSVELHESAVQGDTLLGWQAKGDAATLPVALKWSGTSNRYDIQGKAWVVLKADGSTAMPDGPPDFSGWTKLFTDFQSSAVSLRFRTNGSDSAASMMPGDFVLEDEGHSGAGADPARVGPRTAPKK